MQALQMLNAINVLGPTDPLLPEVCKTFHWFEEPVNARTVAIVFTDASMLFCRGAEAVAIEEPADIRQVVENHLCTPQEMDLLLRRLQDMCA
jgi:hypothetical protein